MIQKPGKPPAGWGHLARMQTQTLLSLPTTGIEQSLWKAITYLCDCLSLFGVVSSLCVVVTPLCFVVSSLCLVM